MHEVGNAADLLKRAIDDGGGGWTVARIDPFEDHFGGGEILAETVVQIAGEAAALVVLGGDHAARETAKLVVECFELFRFSMEFREYTDFRAKKFRINRN